jgi:putative DNA methylase
MSESIDTLLPGLSAAEVNTAKIAAAHPVAPGPSAPLNLAKAVRLPVPDFSDPNRKPVCLEIDFPIAPINALSQLEGNAGKPIYQMSKWWARRRSSVFRSLLISAATEAPDDPAEAGQRVWDHYYANHLKAGSFKNLKVLDCFMGGGTTLVEGSRLGFQVTGVDLNPVAWFVVKNELAGSDPTQVRALFARIEEEVRPQIAPFYATSCPRGHRGAWIDSRTGQPANVDLLSLAPAERKPYRWHGPEVIYTFWAKHGPCRADGHRTPVLKTPVIAEKRLSADYLPCTCPSCGHVFDVELGETRMAPTCERVVLENEPSFTETSQTFATLLSAYGKGNGSEKRATIGRLLVMLQSEAAFKCPECSTFAGTPVQRILERHADAARVGDIKKKDLGIEKRPIFMSLLVHPNWLKGSPGHDAGGNLGGYSEAPLDASRRWFEARLTDLRYIEVRGRIKLADEDAVAIEDEPEAAEEVDTPEGETEEESDRKKFGLPRVLILADGSTLSTREGNVPSRFDFKCCHCGRKQDLLEAVKETQQTAPVFPVALQCHCPQCADEGYNYNGRYFKAPDTDDIRRLVAAEQEWDSRKNGDLSDYWPREHVEHSHMTHQRSPLDSHGYVKWANMFVARQLLLHAGLLKNICRANEGYSADVLFQALGAFQQYLRNQSCFTIWNIGADKLEPQFANNNYNPPRVFIENSAWGHFGRGNWSSCTEGVLEGLEWARDPWEVTIRAKGEKSVKLKPGDPVDSSACEILCSSSAELPSLENSSIDLVITDPPFGNNLYYADLADFFYVWIKRGLLQLGPQSEALAIFSKSRTPHAAEAVVNPAEHPDDREKWEQEIFIAEDTVATIRDKSPLPDLAVGGRNPCYRREPSSDFYQKTLSMCWAEACRVLKPGGLMAFTFHHSDDEPWYDVLEALFDAGFYLIATYPIRSDESKGKGGAFGSRKIEFDIVHVCRKRIGTPEIVPWRKMRDWVKGETTQLKTLLEHTHGKDLAEADLRVILRGKALEFYSRHYGAILTGDDTLLPVREAMLGINLILDDLLASSAGGEQFRAPDAAEPATRFFLRVFRGRKELPRDDLTKEVFGSGLGIPDLANRGWLRILGTTAIVVSCVERFMFFATPGRNRKVLKTDLDQAHFLIGSASPNSRVDILEDLNRGTWRPKKSVESILEWFARTDPEEATRLHAANALQLLQIWRAEQAKKPSADDQQATFFERLEMQS